MGDLKTSIQEDLIVSAVDGYELAASYFPSTNNSDKIILINSAAGVKRRFYLKFAEYFSERGYAVYTYDYRGIGGSRPNKLRGFKAKMHEWGLLDMNGIMDYIRKKHPESTYYAIGHSIGGQILGMSRHNSVFKKAITVGAQEGYWKYWDGIWKLGMIFFWYFIIPIIPRLFGYFPAEKVGFAEDLPKGVALEWGSWGRNKSWFFNTIPEAAEFFPKFSGGLMGISINDDNYAPIRSVDALMSRFTNADLYRKHIHPEEYGVNSIGHFSLFRSKFKGTIWKDLLNFLNN